MTENEAIAKFKRTSVLWESATNTEMVEAVKIAINALEEIQPYRSLGAVEELREAREKQKWIPCSERLPEEDNYILLSFENFTIPLVGRYEEDDNGGAFYVCDDTETCVSQNLFVNAWQPLPEPYKSA